MGTKRQKLIVLSQIAKVLVEQGEFERVNDALVSMYSEDAGVSVDDWGTFNSWKEQGLIVKKGEKGSTIWGRKRKIEVKDAGGNDAGGNTEEKATAKAMRFYPTATIFNRTQVDKAEVKVKAESK